MKKTFIMFLFLLIISGTIFTLGWIQYRVKPDCCGIVISKLHGVSKTPVKPGEFYWNWEFLLPTNAKLQEFSVTPVNLTKTVTGTLPSGDLYSSIYNINNGFDYKFSYSMSLSCSPEQIAELYRQNKITDNGTLSEFLKLAGDTIAQATTAFYLKKLAENPTFTIESLRRDDLLKEIKVYREIPEIDVYLLSVTESRVPDFDLYTRLKNRYISEKSSESFGAINSSSETETQNTDIL